MKPIHSKFLIVIIITAITSGVVFAINQAEPLKNENFFDFPLQIGDWSGKQVQMSDYVYKGIETPYLFLRNYRSPRYNTLVNLSIVWFDDTNIAFHTPESCLGGLGNRVKEKSTVFVNLIEEHRIAKLIVGKNEAQKQLVLYFFDVDGHITTNQIALRLHIFSQRLRFRRTSASFIRVMAPITESQQETKALLVDFLRDIYPILPKYTYTASVKKTDTE